MKVALCGAIFLVLKFGCGDHVHLLKFADHENNGVAPSQDHELEPHPRPILVNFYEFSEFFRHESGTTADLNPIFWTALADIYQFPQK